MDRASDRSRGAAAACRSARDRLIVLLMARAGLRRGELCGLRRSDVHLLPDSASAGVRGGAGAPARGAPGQSERGVGEIPPSAGGAAGFPGGAGLLTPTSSSACGVPRAAVNDFVLVNLFREPIGAAMPPDAINDADRPRLAAGRAWIAQTVRPHQLRHAFASNVADAGGGLDEIADLLGHASLSSSQVYLHPDPGRLRAAIDRVPSPRTATAGAEVTAPSVIGSAAMAALPGSVVPTRPWASPWMRGMCWVLAALSTPRRPGWRH